MRNWFTNIFKREASSPKVEVTNIADYAYPASPVTVRTPQMAMKIAAVYRAVALLSDSIAKLPLCYKRKNAEGFFSNDERDKLYWLLRENPNPRQTSFILMQNLVQHVLLYGNAYVYPRRMGGEITELILLDPHTTIYDVYADTYTVSDLISGVHGTFDSDEILHFKGRSLDGGYTGVSVITYAATTLGIAATGDREMGARFATGGKFKAIYHQQDDGEKGFSSGAYQNEEMEGSANDIEKRLNSGRSIIYVPGAGKLSPLSMTSTDLQFLESRKFTVTEIARFFGVPRAKIMDDSSMNYKSAELVNADLYGDGMSPIMTMIEMESKKKLIPHTVRPFYKIVFDIRPLYASDPMTKALHDSKELANGVKTVNDLRRDDDLPPVENGDVPYISANLIPLGSKIDRTSAPSEPQKEDDEDEEKDEKSE